MVVIKVTTVMVPMADTAMDEATTIVATMPRRRTRTLDKRRRLLLICRRIWLSRLLLMGLVVRRLCRLSSMGIRRKVARLCHRKGSHRCRSSIAVHLRPREVTMGMIAAGMVDMITGMEDMVAEGGIDQSRRE